MTRSPKKHCERKDAVVVMKVVWLWERKEVLAKLGLLAGTGHG